MADESFELSLRQYRSGNYSREAPRRPGLYAVWARDGHPRGYVFVKHHQERSFYVFEGRVDTDPARLHVGWWWSQPLPSLPLAPAWIGDRDA